MYRRCRRRLLCASTTAANSTRSAPPAATTLWKSNAVRMASTDRYSNTRTRTRRRCLQIPRDHVTQPLAHFPEKPGVIHLIVHRSFTRQRSLKTVHPSRRSASSRSIIGGCE